MASLSDAVARPRVIINTNDIPSEDGNNVVFNKPLSLSAAVEQQPETTVTPKIDAQPTTSIADPEPSKVEPEPNKVQAILDKLFGLHGQERYQLWPEKLARDALSAPHDVMTGQIPQYEVDPMNGEVHTSSGMIKAAQDVSALAGTGGLAGTGKEAGVSLGVVPVDVAKKLNFKTGNVSDDLKAAVQNTAGASIDADGHLIVKVTRAQHPNQEMAESVRGGVFYQPSGNKSFSYTGKNNYGGSQKVDGETAYLNPLVVKGATGGKAPETAYNQLIGDKKAYANMRADAIKTLGTYGKRPDAADVWKFLDKYAPELSDYAQYIIDNSKSGNQLPYALQEAAVASAARKAGHDGIVGYSVGRDGTKRLSEIFDVRENRYPSPDGDYSVHPELLADSSKESAALQANKPFYSAVENAVAAAKQPTAEAQQWLGYLKNQPGVKQEELQHLGLDKLQGPITKDDLLKAVQEGQPQINEVVKDIRDTKLEQWKVIRPDGHVDSTWTNPDAAAKQAEKISGSVKEAHETKPMDTTKYRSYQLPGGPLSRDTEILTNRGWKRIDAVEIGDIVMTRQDETDLLEWQPVEATTKVYAEELYHFFSQSINMRVTENHQMIAKKRRRNGDGLVRLTAKELWNRSEMLVPLTGIWNGGKKENIFDFNPNDLAELFGWYLAEGSYKHKNGNKHTIQISQCREYNPEKCDRIEALLNRMSLPWRYYGDAYGIGIKTINKDLVELFHEQPTSEFKFVPYFFFNQSMSVIQSLLDGLILGDGCTVIIEDGLDKTTFFTKSQQLADDVQILILMTGKCATVRQRPSGLYCVGIEHKEWSSIDDAKFEIAPYNDFAFCVTVENHAIYVRRHGVAAFTGNSNYREMLLTLPPTPKVQQLFEVRPREGKNPFAVYAKGAKEHLKSFPTKEEADAFANNQNNLNFTTSTNDYKSSHWDEPNVLAHIRMNDRMIDGKKSLHLEEIQSDWMQSHRKELTNLHKQIDNDFDSIADRMVKAGVIKKVCD